MKKTGATERKKEKDLRTSFKEIMWKKLWLLVTVLAMAMLLSIGTASADMRSSTQPVIAAGGGHSLVIKSDGTLWAWGYNSHGQLGDGTNANRNTPTQIGADNNWVSIAVGEEHTLALRSDGTLWSWGYGASGQLGYSTTETCTVGPYNQPCSTVPTKVGTDNNWVAVSAGRYHTIALKSDGTLWSWGYGVSGQLGDGTNIRSTPTQIGPDTNWVSIAAGGDHTIALKSDGTLWAWGLNDYGQLGDATTESSTVPIQVGNNNRWVSISAGYRHTIAMKSDGTLWAWGANYYDQLGHPSTETCSTLSFPCSTMPAQTGVDNNWVSVSAGADYTIALKSDGTLWAWGGNGAGQLGDGTNVRKNTPVQITTVDTNWASVSAGLGHTIALKSDGSLWAWGNNTSGELGDGTTIPKSTPRRIGTDNNWISIAGGHSHNVALKSDGTLWAWGRNYNGELGYTTTESCGYFSEPCSTVPSKIGTDENWVSIATGGGHTIALKSDGSLWAWGGNNCGQLGDGTTNDKTTPTRIGLDNNWVSISAGGHHTLAVKSDGTLWAWGLNGRGQLGYTSSEVCSSGSYQYPNSTLPAKIGMDNNWVSIEAGGNHTLALKSDGTLWAWGYNWSGQVGDGTNVTDDGSNNASKNVPMQIGTDNNWIGISAGGHHSLGLKSDGSRWAWGANGYGQLGNGTDSDKDLPAQIATDNNWMSISAGWFHTTGVKSDGTLWAWGSNGSGQLGDGTTTSRSSPVQILSSIQPTANAGLDQIVEATSSSGASVMFDGSGSSDPDGTISSYSWSGNFGTISGSTALVALPFGTHTITLTVTDNGGLTATDTVQVTVQDTTPPGMSLPADVTTIATGPAGAVVTYTVMASDVVNGPIAPNCAPASGSLFPIGTTTVNCSATDGAGNTTTGSFSVTVLDDTIPDVFVFFEQSDVALNSLVISNTITVSGITTPVGISVLALQAYTALPHREYSINGGTFTATSGVVNNGDTVRVQQLSASTFSTTTDAVLIIGGVSAVFRITTKPNTQPVANAGFDQTAHAGDLVTLDGSGSSDPDGNVPLAYVWNMQIKPSGSTASLSDPLAVNPTFTPDLPGDYVIELVVADSLGAESQVATITISTINTAPIAAAGPDQAVTLIGSMVNFDGSKSYDLDGDSITYNWTVVSIPAGSSATLSNANTATPAFTADVYGTYVVQLVVSDSWTESVADAVVVSFENVKPVANAGLSQSSVVGDTVTLNGSNSSDANGNPLTYSWSVATAPAGSLAGITSPASATTSFVPDLPGTYVIQLVVNDGYVNSDAATIQIEVVDKQTAASTATSDVQTEIITLPPDAFQNPTMQNALTNKLNAAIANINAGNFGSALNQLQNDILKKTDGCATAGAPDKNDWIATCEEQNQIYPFVIQAIERVQSMM